MSVVGDSQLQAINIERSGLTDPSSLQIRSWTWLGLQAHKRSTQATVSSPSPPSSRPASSRRDWSSSVPLQMLFALWAVRGRAKRSCLVRSPPLLQSAEIVKTYADDSCRCPLCPVSMVSAVDPRCTRAMPKYVLTPSGYHGAANDLETLKAEATKVGYPLLIKPTHGGGGKGMRTVRNPADLEEEILSAKREAAKSFGNDEVLLERWLEQPRHVEVQVFADGVGGCVALWERDCSVQRRHQSESKHLLGCCLRWTDCDVEVD